MTDTNKIRTIHGSFLPAASLALLLTACSPRQAATGSDALPTIFPDYTGVTVPVNIAPLNFQIDDATYIRADFACQDKALGTVANRGCAVDIPVDDWQQWLRIASGKELTVTVSAWDDQHPDGVSYAPFTISVSPDSIDAYVTYRLIEPGYESWQDIGIWQRNLSNFEETAIVSNTQNNGGCLNCHSFQNYSPDRMLFHARGAGGGTVFWMDGQATKVNLKESNLGMQGVYPMWHKDGRFVVFSTNKTSQSFYSAGRSPIEVYDMMSDIFIYDTQTGQEMVDPRFHGSAHFETFPAFSPDGNWLYFCTADSVNLDTEFNQLRYSIVRVPFSAKDGSLGEPIDTLYNANADQHSASFPRISPDGRWLMFTRSDFATFPIWHREADLYAIDMLPAVEPDSTHVLDCVLWPGQQQVHALDVANSPETESYHSFSSNGRWVVFSSRRIDSRYTRLFFTHFADDGTVTKPFLLPQQDPAENTYRLKSYNIPEYLKAKATLPKKEVTRLFQ